MGLEQIIISGLIVQLMILGLTCGQTDEVNLSIKCEARPGCNCDLSEVERLKQEVEEVRAEVEILSRSIPCQFRADQGWFALEDDEGNCYQYMKTSTRQNWNQSRELCQAEGGDLAFLGIRSDNVKSEVISTVEGNDPIWIGLDDIQTEGSFVWIDGSPLQPSDLTWLPGTPDNFGNNEDCVELNRFGNRNPIRGNDENCESRIIHALCERPIGPITTKK